MSVSFNTIHRNNTFRFLLALTLICFGILAILVNFNYVSSGVWSRLNRLWPTWLIIAGLMVFLKDQFRMKIVGTVMILGVFLILVITHQQVQPFSIAQFEILSRLPLFSTTQDYKKSFSVPANFFSSNIETHDMNLLISTGELRIEDKSHTRDIEVKVSAPLESPPSFEYATESAILKSSLNVPRVRNMQTTESDINLGTSALPTNLSITQNTGSQKLKLNNLPLNSLVSKLDTGIIDLTLSKNASASANLDLNVNVGTIKLTLPSSFGLKIDHSIAVGALHIKGESIRDMSEYISENYDNAATKINIKADVGVGKIEVILVE